MKDFYIYGRNAVIEQLTHNPKNLKTVFMVEISPEIKNLASKNKIAVQSITEKEIDKILKDKVTHQGVLALSKPFEYTHFDEWFAKLDIKNLPTLLILDHIQDVSNLGAIIRTATAAGVAGILVAELNQAPITSAVYKTSAGTVGKVPIIQIGNINQTIEKLKKGGFWITGLAATSGATSIWDYSFDEPTALVIGGEGEGIRQKTMEHCDTLLSIPMKNNVESLNASVATAVVCYEIMRQRTNK